ncbi:2-isopropylmalate synthase [Eubacteriales bacterium KG125]
MLDLSPKTNLLEKKEYSYELQDVEKPKLYRDMYSYKEIPKIVWNHRRVPMNMPSDIWITDTTFRDGMQSRAPYDIKDIVEIFKLLSKLGGPFGIIRQSEFFVYTKKDREAVEKCLELGLKFPEITTWIRANKSDFQLVKSLGIKETGILVSCSDYHIFKKMKKTRKQAMEYYLETINDALETGVVPRCHLEDITRADFYGFVVPFVNKIMELSEASGVPIKIRACDTMGYGVPYPGVALPRSVPGIIYGLQHYSGVPSEMLEWHGHNDFYKAVVNASMAWMYGCSSVNCSLLGIGERTGNIPLEAMVMEYASLRGSTDGMETQVITEIAEFFRDRMGYDIPPMTPFVGADFNVTRAGIHADGLMKDEEIYNIFDTREILGRDPGVSISKTSGAAGIAYWLNQHPSVLERLGVKNRISKDHKIVSHLKSWVDKLYDDNRTTSLSSKEIYDKLAEMNEVNWDSEQNEKDIRDKEAVSQ